MSDPKITDFRPKWMDEPDREHTPEDFAGNCSVPPPPGADHPQAVRIVYTNWRGETAPRTIIPRDLTFGATSWHPEPQWLLDAWDVGKGAERTFALRDIREWGEREEAP